MDPQAAWSQLLDAYAKGNWTAVEELSEGLLNWLTHGGFPPQSVPNKKLDEDWNRAITLAACRFARSVARNHRSEECGS